MKITISKPGLMSTVQDLGRMNYLSQAVPVSGAMDTLSAQIANKAVGNDPNKAVIEFMHGGAQFFAETDLLIALSGDGSYLSVNGRRLPSERPVFIPAGTTVSLENNRLGSCSCLAIAGGWDVPEILGSRSTFITAKIGGLNGRGLKANDQLLNRGVLTQVTQAILNTLKGETINYPKWSIARELFLPPQRKTIRIMRGREFDWFDEHSIEELLSKPFTIGNNSNRMGYRLSGPLMSRKTDNELLSTAVTPGTIQVTGDGNLVLLMADCQTTGGYPRIAQVTAADLPLCAQLKPGDTIDFKEISWSDAEALYLQRESDLHKLTMAIGYKYALV